MGAILSTSHRLRGLFQGAFSLVRTTPSSIGSPPSISVAVSPRVTPNGKPAGTWAQSQDIDEPEDLQGNPFLAEALSHIKVGMWGRAQRALYKAVRDSPSGEAECYLEEVRAIRRCLRQLDKYPRDAQLHLELGQLYFRLELGDEALQEWSRAVELEPGLGQGHYCLGVEYLFQDRVEEARQSCERANRLDPSLPTFENLRFELEQRRIDL